jgi:peptidyl-prolyl cis-trans isomerase A (cyclophilin A)
VTIAGNGVRPVLIATGGGNMIVGIDSARAPATAAHFLQDVTAGRYDGTTIFRISTLANQDPADPAPVEILQGGARQPAEPVEPCIRHESTRDTGLRHRRGTISLSRFAPGAVYHSFFLCRGDQPDLDFGGARQPDGQGFAAFGAMLEGFDVLDRLFAHAEPEEVLTREIPIFTAKLL